MTNLLDEEEVEADDDDVLGTSPSVSNCLLCYGSFVTVVLSHSWSLLAKKKALSLQQTAVCVPYSLQEKICCSQLSYVKYHAG